MIIADMTSKNKELYIRYIEEHRINVCKSYKMNKLAILDITGLDDMQLRNIQSHDMSKYSEEEFNAYRKHFYPTLEELCNDNNKEFDYAWLHHIHNNPHHWQYWTLDREALDMPVKYIVEMLCDWHSFSAHNPSDTAYNYYTKYKDKMLLSDSTRSWIDKLIELFKEPISNNDESTDN